jgi:hypothetical protein
LAAPHGFTLSMTGVVATTVEHRPHPGPVAIWLFVSAAALTYSAAARYCAAAPVGGASTVDVPAFGLFFIPMAVVGVVDVATWWIGNNILAFVLAGTLAMFGYLAAFATLSTVRTRLSRRGRSLGGSSCADER